MKWLSNIYDPEKPNAKMFIITMFNETPEQAWERRQRWLDGKIIAHPQATEKYTVHELTSMGMVGVYLP